MGYDNSRLSYKNGAGLKQRGGNVKMIMEAKNKTVNERLMEIRDLWLAAALKSEGVIPERTQKNEEGFLNFFFKDTPEYQNCKQKAEDGTLMVNWKKFVTAFRDFKDMKYRS